MKHIYLVLAAVLFVFYIVRTYLSPARRRLYGNGFAPPVQLSSWNIISGPGTFIEAFLLTATSQLITKSKERFASLGRTFQTKSLGITTFHTADPANLQVIFNTRSADWGVVPQRLPVRELVGVGIITSDGAFHDESRELLKPMFEARFLENFATFDALVQQLFDLVPRDGSAVDLQPLLLHMHLDMSCSFLFGDDLGALAGTSTMSAQDFRTAFEAGLRGAGLRIGLGPLAFLLPRKKWLESCRVVHSFVEKYVDQAMEMQKTSQVSDDSKKPRTFLERVAEATPDRKLLRDQVLNGLMASLENVAVLQSNCIHVLARMPEEWKRLQQEARSLDDSKLTTTTLRSLPLVKNFIQETLRLYPILFRAPRVALCDTVLPTGGGPNGNLKIVVPAGSHGLPYVAPLHIDPQIWGDDAHEFKPDRWNTFKPTPWQFMPFGGGARACLGRQKTILETTYLLVRLLREFDRIESRDDRGWAPLMKITTRNANGCRVALYRK